MQPMAPIVMWSMLPPVQYLPGWGKIFEDELSIGELVLIFTVLHFTLTRLWIDTQGRHVGNPHPLF
jgi:hypothetical protein